MESSSMDPSLSTNSEQEYKGPQTRSNYNDDEQGVIDKSRDGYQRIAWNKLYVSIGYLINKVNAINIGTVKKELLKQNMIRGKHIFCELIIQSQFSSTTDTHIYATLVAVINLVLPEIGELVLNKCIMQIKSTYLEDEISNCSASVMFIGHLINHGVADEKLAVELLTNFLEKPDMISIKIAVIILKICGKKLSEIHKDFLNEIFDDMLNFLDYEELDEKDEFDLKLIFKLQENGFKFQQLDLVPVNECQITHFLTLDSVVNTASNTLSYHYDPKFELNEKMYKNLILNFQGCDSEEENELESVTDFNNQYDGEKKMIEVMKYIDDIEKDINMLSLRNVCLRKMINIIDLTMDYTELVQKILKYSEVDMSVWKIIMDCCCEHSTYKNHFGKITEEINKTDKNVADMLEIAFIHCYVTRDNTDPHRSLILASYFAHLSYMGVISWKLSSIMEEESFFSKIFSKQFCDRLNNIL